ncbi:hypothetical protein ENSA7_79300 [Enhygromyxa salina]|uniref:Uncharacterized protein n=1 Tax=Enhygromyxa salina TaxID=215803 RepID=A0A2S9XKZ1_9BACT|nr:hypothetical protein ENSA7_79300 [Enhygromyxa salina]
MAPSGVHTTLRIMMNSISHRAPLVLVVLLSGCGTNCDGRELSDNGQYWVQPSLYDLLGHESRRVLVGTEFYVEIADLAVEGEIDGDQGGIECVGRAGSGVLDEYEPSYFRVTAAGEGAVELLSPRSRARPTPTSSPSLGPIAMRSLALTRRTSPPAGSPKLARGSRSIGSNPGRRAHFQITSTPRSTSCWSRAVSPSPPLRCCCSRRSASASRCATRSRR